MSDVNKTIEVDNHAINLKKGRFTVNHARQIAVQVAAVDRSDPFIYSRVVSSLMRNTSQPEDYQQFMVKSQHGKGK